MIKRELKRQLDLLFASQREQLQALADLADRVHVLECTEDFQYSSYEGVIEASDDWQVYVTDPGEERRKLLPRYDLANHSPDGFSWGYVGSGPAQLAIAMLSHHCRHEAKAIKLAGQFLTGYVAALPMGTGWTCTSTTIDDWLSDIGEL